MKTENLGGIAAPDWARQMRLIAFCLYAVCSLLSQATMSIGVAILFLAIVVGEGGPRPYWRSLSRLISVPGVRGFLGVSLGFVLVIALSLAGTWLWPVAYNGKSADVSLPSDLGKAWYFISPFVLASGLLALKAGERRIVLRTWIITLFVLSLVSYVQFFTGWPRAQVIPTLRNHFHAVLFFGHHLSTASILIFPFFAVMDCISRPGGSRFLGLTRSQACVVLGAGAVALFLTFSRALWGAIPIAVIAWSVFRFGKKAAYAAIAVVLLVAAASQVPLIKHRFSGGMNLSDREELWVANLDFFKARPVLGVGFRKNHQMSGYYLKQKYPTRTWIFAGHAHNNFLDMLGGLGILGVSFWLLWCLWVAWLPYRAWKAGGEESGFALGLIAAWTAFQVNGVTQVNFWEGKVMHQMMWAAAWGIVFYVTTRSARKPGKAA